MSRRLGLHRAALTGNWELFSTTFDGDLEARITDKAETALHIAAAARQEQFIHNFVNHIKQNGHLVTRRYLEMENANGNTALCYAAATGNVRIAKMMTDAYDYGKNVRQGGDDMLPDRGQVKPLVAAAQSGCCEMTTFLFPKTNVSCWSGEDRFELLTYFIGIGLCDEALKMLRAYPQLGTTQKDDDVDIALIVLARKPSVFACESQSWCRRIIDLCMKSRNDEKKRAHAIDLVEELHRLAMVECDVENIAIHPNKKIAQALMIAALKGNEEFLIALIRVDPNLMWKTHKQHGSIIHIAVRNRYESIFNFCCELGCIVDFVAVDTVDGEENLLHLAAKLAPQPQLSIVSGAALQMQRELLWFKEVEKMVQPSYREMENSEGKTPQVLFSEEHKDLMRAGEKWMKETSNSSMVVAALIATVMFTTAFTVPGGYSSFSGEPIFENKKFFSIFFMADALALFCSSTSILVFHSIITSRYTENDFLESLPFRLMIGVTSLFVSVAAMMVAFCAAFPLYFPHNDVSWSFALFGLFACVPSLYVSLKYPLLVDLIHSTYDSRFMFRSRKRLF